MDTVIDTGGHQIDQFSRFKKEFKLGNITSEHIKWFLGISRSEKDALANGHKIPLEQSYFTSAFEECLYESNDISTIEAPKEDITLEYILRKHKNSILECDIIKSNLISLTHGTKFKVKVFSPKFGTAGIDQCAKFLQTKKGVINLGFRGLMLVLDQKGQILKKAASYFTPEREGEYFENKYHSHCTPSIMVCYGKEAGNKYENAFRIKTYETRLGVGDRFLGFFEVENE